MSLSLYFSLRAPAAKSATELESCFKIIEKEAQRLGFRPTLVLNAKFDTAERREFARRLTSGLVVEDQKLKNVKVDECTVFSHDPTTGRCRLIPEHGVILVATDQQKTETVFALFQFPQRLHTKPAGGVVETNVGEDWRSDDFIDSPDPKFREVLSHFAAAGYLRNLKDEFASGRNELNGKI